MAIQKEDKNTGIDILKDDVKGRKIRSLYLFYGPEEYLVKYYLNSIEALLLSGDMKSLNKIVLEGKLTAGKIIDACEAMPVFSDRKLVIVKNSGLFKGKKKGQDGNNSSKAGNDDLLEYLAAVPDYNCLIFIEDEVDKRLKLQEAVKNNGLVVEFAFQKPASLVKWVVKFMKSQRKDIDTVTASQLVESSDGGMTELMNEMDKLVLYLGGRNNVTGEDINAVCTRSIKGHIFELTDAVSERDGARALKLLNDMILLREPIPRILFMITRQCRMILEMKLLLDTGISSAQAAAKMGMTPFVAGKITKHTSRFSTSVLKHAIEESLELDVAVKTGKINDRVAAELLITQLVGN